MIKATLIDNMGSDERIVDAARVSFDKTSGNYTPEQNERLIKYLAKHGHWTPFSHPQITMLYEVPIFVARQEFKHIVGFTRNEVSRRYMSGEPEFYIPDYWRNRPEGSVKQGSIGTNQNSQYWTDMYQALMLEACRVYQGMLTDGVAPEQARMILPQSMMTSYYVTGSLAAFARMHKQRSQPDAQREIQILAGQVSDILKPLYPMSWSALTDD